MQWQRVAIRRPSLISILLWIFDLTWFCWAFAIYGREKKNYKIFCDIFDKREKPSPLSAVFLFMHFCLSDAKFKRDGSCNTANSNGKWHNPFDSLTQKWKEEINFSNAFRCSRANDLFHENKEIICGEKRKRLLECLIWCKSKFYYLYTKRLPQVERKETKKNQWISVFLFSHCIAFARAIFLSSFSLYQIVAGDWPSIYMHGYTLNASSSSSSSSENNYSTLLTV